jgi:shikimate dehydrogenase
VSRKAFVVGWPIKHSRSPIIHRFWLARHGLDGDYVRQAVEPENLPEFLRSFPRHGFVGGNVTIPHKEAAFAACSMVTPVAERLGAVNTLWIEDGRLCGDNTDAEGFAANLDDRMPGWRTGGAALVLGAGGAARAVIQALVDAGFASVVVLNRTQARAEAVAAVFGDPVRAVGLADIDRHIPDADLVVNTTSAGMGGGDALDLDWSRARPDAIATDIVYVPLETQFLADAARHGLRTVDGLGMLLHQAVPGFQRWFGVRPAVDEALRREVLADLA